MVPGPFWDRRTQTLILLRFLVTEEPRTRFPSPSLKGVKQGSCLPGDGRKENPRLFGWGRMVTAACGQGNTSGGAWAGDFQIFRETHAQCVQCPALRCCRAEFYTAVCSLLCAQGRLHLGYCSPKHPLFSNPPAPREKK